MLGDKSRQLILALRDVEEEDVGLEGTKMQERVDEVIAWAVASLSSFFFPGGGQVERLKASIDSLTSDKCFECLVRPPATSVVLYLKPLVNLRSQVQFRVTLLSSCFTLGCYSLIHVSTLIHKSVLEKTKDRVDKWTKMSAIVRWC